MNKYLASSLILCALTLSACDFPFNSNQTRPIRPIPAATPPPPIKAQPYGTISMAPDDQTTSDETPDQDKTDAAQSEGGDFSIYLIALNDKGESGQKIGCDDSVVPVQQTSANGGEQSNEQLLKEAYQKLLSIKTSDYGESGFTNTLANSNLKLESATIKDSKAIIKLTGQLVSGGTCDDPRLKAQLQQTALQFPEIKSTEITLNGKTLDQVLSAKG